MFGLTWSYIGGLACWIKNSDLNHAENIVCT